GNLGDLRFRMRAGVARIGHQVVEPAIFDGELAGVLARSATGSFCHGHFLHPMNSTSCLSTPHAPFWPRMFFLRALVCDRKLPDFQAPRGAQERITMLLSTAWRAQDYRSRHPGSLSSGCDRTHTTPATGPGPRTP